MYWIKAILNHVTKQFWNILVLLILFLKEGSWSIHFEKQFFCLCSKLNSKIIENVCLLLNVIAFNSFIINIHGTVRCTGFTPNTSPFESWAQPF